MVLTLLSIAAVVGVLLASGVAYCLRHASHHRLKDKLSGLGGSPGPDATADYQVTRFCSCCFGSPAGQTDCAVQPACSHPPPCTCS